MRARDVHGEVLVGPDAAGGGAPRRSCGFWRRAWRRPRRSCWCVGRTGISSGQLYTWRRQFRTGELTGFAPVTLAPPAGELPAATVPADPALTPAEANRLMGVIEVKLSSGVKRCLTGAADEAMLRRGAVGAVVIGVPGNVRVYLACGVTDMRKGFDGLAARVQTVLQLDPHGGALFVFRGRRGDLLKVLWWDGQGLCLFAKRLERGHFLWPQAKDGSVVLTPAQLAMLLEGIDWRAPRRSWAPEAAG